MYIESIMTTDVIQITEEARINEMNALMREHVLQHLPVVNDSGKLVGMVSSHDIQKATPSEITTLTVGESNFLLSKVNALQIMQKELVCCMPTTLIEEAAQMLRKQAISSLPVVNKGKLVGIVTIEDILDFFLDITGCQQPDSTRIAVHLDDIKGNLSRFLDKVNEFGGYIISVASPTEPNDDGKRVCIVRYYADDPHKLNQHLKESGIDLISENYLSEDSI